MGAKYSVARNRDYCNRGRATPYVHRQWQTRIQAYPEILHPVPGVACIVPMKDAILVRDYLRWLYTRPIAEGVLINGERMMLLIPSDWADLDPGTFE